MRHLFNNPLGSCAPPCAPTFKQNLLAGADLLGSMISSITNYISTQDATAANKYASIHAQEHEDERTAQTNLMNKQIADEANRYNKLMQDEQNAWNLEQWNRENEYNSPSEVVKRLKAAGINPYTYATNGAGSIPASSLQSAQARDAVVAQMQKPDMVTPPHMIAPQLDMPSMSDVRLKNAQADRLNADTQIAHAQEKRNSDIFPAQLEYARKLAKEKGYLGDMARETLAYYQVSRKYDLAKLMGDIQAQRDMHYNYIEQRLNTQINNQLLRIEAAYAPQMKEAELRNYRNVAAQIKANIGLINANKLLTDEQRLHEIEKKWNTIIDGDGKTLDNSLKRDLYNSTIRQYEADIYLKTAQASKIDRENRGVYIDLPFGKVGFSIPQTSPHGTQYNWR